MESPISLTPNQLRRWNHVRHRAGVDEDLTMEQALGILRNTTPEGRSLIMEYIR